MKILGISALDSDATASLVVDGQVVASVAEERFSRVKLHAGFPFQSVDWILQECQISPSEIDAVTYSFHTPVHEFFLKANGLIRHNLSNIRHGGSLSDKLLHAGFTPSTLIGTLGNHAHYNRQLREGLNKWGLWDKLVRVPHHMSHAASVFYPSGFDRALVLTLDAYGSGLAGKVCLGVSGEGLTTIRDFPFPNSLGNYYGQVTQALGFQPNRHEGKVVGLAALGSSENGTSDGPSLYDLVRSRFSVSDGNYVWRSGLNRYFPFALTSLEASSNGVQTSGIKAAVRDRLINWVRRTHNVPAQGYTQEDIAHIFQKVLEDVIAEVVRYYVKRFDCSRVAIAGGVAANVKMNQRIAEVDGVEEIFVYPNMGDGGTASGGALYHHAQHHPLKTAKIRNVFRGPAYSNEDIEHELRLHDDLKYEFVDDIAVRIAQLLADKKIVARFHGKMEYGPRALGHRSILSHAEDPSINTWLNQRLRRTEFMPFAPATLAEFADKCYLNVEKVRDTARFMTVTCDCTDYMQKVSPATCHVDGTARPQLIDEDTAPDFYAILKRYYELTNIPSVLNTSFNIHEEPIVLSPADAVRAFRQSKLDYLAIENYLVCLRVASVQS